MEEKLTNLTSLDFNKICRCCLSENEIKNIFQDVIIDDEKINLRDVIVFVTSIQISDDDKLPNNICLKCIGDIYTSYKCKQLWIKSDETLKYYLEIVENNIVYIEEDNDTDIDHVVVKTIDDDDNKNDIIKIEIKDDEDSDALLEINKSDANDSLKDEFDKIKDENVLNDGRLNDSDQIKNNASGRFRNVVRIFRNPSGKINPRDKFKSECGTMNDVRRDSGKDERLRADSDELKHESDLDETLGDDIEMLDSDGDVEMLDDSDGAETVDDPEKSDGSLNQCEFKGIKDELLTMDNELFDKAIIKKKNVKRRKVFIKYCQRCQIHFASHEDYIEHRLRVKHPKETLVECSECDRVCRRSRLKIHMRTHTKEQPFACTYCDSKFSLNANLRRHMMIHTGERPHKCEICGKAFIQSTSLKQHIRTHTGEKPYECKYCGKRYGQRSLLNLHLVKHGVGNKTKKKLNPDDPNESLYNCDLCNRVYKSKPALNFHKLTHGEKKYLCSFCGQSYKTPTGLQSHSKIHTGERPYTCEVCKKTFAQSGGLKTHMLIHSGEKPYICAECGKQFTQPNHLIYHSRTHTGEKPYKCNVCGKCFALNGNLTVHMRTHTGETPYVCGVCGRGFYDSSSMKKHKRNHHDN